MKASKAWMRVHLHEESTMKKPPSIMKAPWESTKTPWKPRMKARTPTTTIRHHPHLHERIMGVSSKHHQNPWSMHPEKASIPPSKRFMKHRETPLGIMIERKHREKLWKPVRNMEAPWKPMHAWKHDRDRCYLIPPQKHHGWEPPINNRESTSTKSSWKLMQWKHHVRAYIFPWKYHGSTTSTWKNPWNSHQSSSKPHERERVRKKIVFKNRNAGGGQEWPCAGGG